MKPLITPRCRTVRSWVLAAHDDDLSVERQVAMNAHLASCTACRRARGELASPGVALRKATHTNFRPKFQRPKQGNPLSVSMITGFNLQAYWVQSVMA